MSRGACKVCWKEFPLTADRVPEHMRFGSLECAGSNTVALDDLDARGARIVDMIGKTIAVANTSQMSAKNEQRCARAVYWTLRERGLLS